MKTAELQVKCGPWVTTVPEPRLTRCDGGTIATSDLSGEGNRDQGWIATLCTILANFSGSVKLF